MAASVFGGFPLADIWHAGLSVVTVADANRQQAQSICEEILHAAWEHRAEFIFDSQPLTETIAAAKQLGEGPIVLLDHADNTASGGTQDTVEVLEEVIKQGLEDVAMFGICDPQAIAEMQQAGVGETVTLSLGGKVDMPTIGRKGRPLSITGKVRAITDGDFVVTVAMGRGTTASMGKAAVLDTGTVQIVVCSKHIEPHDLGCFRSLGIEPTAKKFIILKSRIHYRAGFRAIANHEIPCNGVGVTSSDNSLFQFKAVRRPIYPLELDTPERPNYSS